MDNKPFPDVALTILKDAASINTNLFYTGDYKNRYTISQVVDSKEKALEKKADNLKVIKFQLLCHGLPAQIPSSKERLLWVERQEYRDRIKSYLKSLKEFLQKRDMSLYINYDVCNGARMY